ncbi:MAG: TolC family protein [Verrucomicrobiota bacterium]|nr:TolC family protein [Verrucomicrobiota bacterium]
MIRRGFGGIRMGRLWEWVVAGLILISGCSTAHYRRSADREVYRIIQQVENSVFGRTNKFSIDTRYSGRDPASIAPDEIIGDRMSTNRRILNLEQALDLAIRNSREYQSQREQLYLTALTLTGSRYQFTPQFFARSRGEIDSSVTKDNVRTWSGSARNTLGVSQMLKTGGSIGASVVNDLFRYYTGDPRRSAVSTISVNLVQPLLQGFGKNSAAVENLTQAERNVVYAVRSYSLYQNQFAVNIVSDYFNLLGLKDTVRNNYTNYLRRVETSQYLAARAVDRVRQSEVDDARTAELGARITYINSLASYLSALDAFKTRIGLPLSEKWYLDDIDLRDLESAGLMPVDIDGEAAFGLAVTNHMEILNAIDRFEDSKRKVRISANALKPKLNLFANASLTSEGDTDYTKFDPDKVRTGFGFELDLPLSRRNQRNDYRAALVSFESQLRSLVSTLDGYKDRIDRGLRTLEQQRLNYLNRQMALEVARRRVEMNQLLLEAGRVQIQQVREAQDALIAAQNDVTSSLVRYLQTRLQLLIDLGVLKSDQSKFWLEDPIAMMRPGIRAGKSPLYMPEDKLLPPDHYLEPEQ